MKSFSNFITEAKISRNDFERATGLIIKILEKRSGNTYFRFGGPKGWANINKGRAILYMTTTGHAVRFNHVGNSITSISVWDKGFKVGANCDRRLDIGDLNIVNAVKELTNIILDPNATKNYRVFGSIDESVSNESKMLTEATRTSPKEFYDMIQRDNPRGDLTKVSWDTIKDVALKNDVQIPTVYRSYKVKTARGADPIFDITPVIADGDSDKKSSKSVADYYIKVSKRDPETNKFMTVKGDADAQDMLRKINDVIHEPDTKKLSKNPQSLFSNMCDLTRMVCRKAKNSLVITGGPGIGKTFEVTRTIREEGLSEGKDWIKLSGKMTTVTLYQTLFYHREGKLLLFDDLDSLWSDSDAGNLLKAALDSYDKRTISWYSNRVVNVSKMSAEDKEEFNRVVDEKLDADPDANVKLPSEFDYNGRIIFISNLPQSKIDSAVLNRSMNIDMTLTEDEIFVRIESILENIGDKNVPLDVKQYIFKFIRQETKLGNLGTPSIRTFLNAEDMYRSGLPNWKDLLAYG